jgi:hypothetical protein
MSRICANDEYRSQIGATNRLETIVIRYLSLSSICMYLNLKVVDVFSFTDFSRVYRSAFGQIFPRSQPMRESNISNYIFFNHLLSP